jgi:Mn-containing catalase
MHPGTKRPKVKRVQDDKRRNKMPLPFPNNVPHSLGDAFGHIYTVTSPTVDDLKLMVLIESAGKTLYEHSATGTHHPGVIELLHQNGREELAHAYRVAKAIKAISGENYPPPEPADNPYLQGSPSPAAPLTAGALTKLADTEFGGDALYARWADHIGNEEAAALFRLNGKEESEHGNRLLEAAALL